jgi:hypothetical protein
LKVSTKVFENTILWVLKKVFSKFAPTKKVFNTQKLCVEEKIFKKVFFRIFKLLFTLKNNFSILKILNSNLNLKITKILHKNSQEFTRIHNISHFVK